MTVLTALAAADAALQSVQASVRMASALLEPTREAPSADVCRFCGNKNLKSYESGAGPGSVCLACNRDQREEK